jgi:geranylgeranyl diphosphate synthase type II
LDVISTQEVLGKPIGSDGRNEKSTYVTFEGIEKAQDDVRRLSQEAVDILDSFDREHAFLRELFLYLIHRKN